MAIQGNPSEFKRGWSLKEVCKKSGKSVRVTEEVKFERNPSTPSNPSNPSELERGWRFKEIRQFRQIRRSYRGGGV